MSSEQHDDVEGYVEQALAVQAAGLHGYKLGEAVKVGRAIDELGFFPV